MAIIFYYYNLIITGPAWRRPSAPARSTCGSPRVGASNDIYIYIYTGISLSLYTYIYIYMFMYTYICIACSFVNHKQPEHINNPRVGA